MDRVNYESLVIQDLINLEARGELNTTPWYQRRSVWNNAQKSYLINTLFENKPIPALYIRHYIDLDKAKSIKEIVDGQQRTKTIISYYNNEFPARHPDTKQNLKFRDLNKNQKQSFLMTSIPVGYLLGASDGDVIDIFARINSVSKSLNAQEKRNAQYSGEFKQFSIRNSSSRLDFWRNYSIFSGNDIARMNEVQFLSDLAINIIEGLTDFSVTKLDDYYKRYDENFDIEDETQDRIDRIFDNIINLDPSIIKNTIFNRQPIFFSLCLAINSKEKLSIKKLTDGLIEIDSRFNSDVPLNERPVEDVNFYNACSATTQRITQRRVRDTYIKKFI